MVVTGGLPLIHSAVRSGARGGQVLSNKEMATIFGDDGILCWKPDMPCFATQGQLQLKRCSQKDFQQVVFVPTATAAFHHGAVLARMLL